MISQRQKALPLCWLYNKVLLGMFMELILLTVGILGVAILFMGFRVFFNKNGKFPETEVGHNKEMRKRGIHCAKHEELKCRHQVDKETGCHTCQHQ